MIPPGLTAGGSHRRIRRVHEAKFLRLKRLEDLDLRQLPGQPAPPLAALSYRLRSSRAVKKEAAAG